MPQKKISWNNVTLMWTGISMPELQIFPPATLGNTQASLAPTAKNLRLCVIKTVGLTVLLTKLKSYFTFGSQDRT